MIPQVVFNQIDGALGTAPANARTLVAVGYSEKGTLSPVMFARARDVVAEFGSGAMVDAACYAIEWYGLPVICQRAAQGTAGSVSALVVTGVTGTSVVTVDATYTTIHSSHEIKVLIVTGGTRGTAGIVYRYSLDGGSSWSDDLALGVAQDITIAGVAKFLLGTGTLIAGDSWTASSIGAVPSTTTMGTALDTLAASAYPWDVALIACPMDAAMFDAVEAKFSGALVTLGKWRHWVGNTRQPTAGETETAYRTALSTIFSSKATIFGTLCAGDAWTFTSVFGRTDIRPIATAYAARLASVERHRNIASLKLGPLPGVTIRDSNGNRGRHDEMIDPGLDDLRFVTLRSWDGYAGAFVTRPRIFSNPSSDFRLAPHRRVLNLAVETASRYFTGILNGEILCSAKTGYILEAEALGIERGARRAVADAILSAPMASGVNLTISRTDNILAGADLNAEIEVIPLGYPESIKIRIGFRNPANK